MDVVLATTNGLQRLQTDAITPGPDSLKGRDVAQLEPGLDTDCVYAATDDGVYRIGEGATTVDRCGLSGETVVSIHQAATGRLFAGTRPAHLYASPDGESWHRVDSFDAIPGRAEWTQNYMGPAQIRDIRGHRHAPSKLFVAVETAGVYCSPDGGSTWMRRSRGLDNDPHGLRMLGPDTLIATCGRGLYRTDDAGRTWYRLDTHHDQFWYQYFREGILHDGTYYTCAMDRSTHRYDDADPGVILSSTDGGQTLDAHEYPGQSNDYVNAWTISDESVVGGTVDGRVLVGPDEWEVIDSIDATIRSLALTP